MLDRWVRRVHDMPDAVAARMAHYASVMGRGSESWQSVLDALLPGRLIRLDGSLSPHRLLHSAKQALGFERYPIVQAPRILQQHVGDSNQTDNTPDLKTLDDLVKVYNGDGEEQTLCGPLSLSAWGPFCPVALSEVGAASLGRSCRAMLDASMTDAGVAKPKYAAEYCGKVFMLSSREALQMFVANPLPYVSEAAEVPRVRVLVLGPPCVGKSEVARSLAARYDAQHVDALKMLGLSLPCVPDDGRQMAWHACITCTMTRHPCHWVAQTRLGKRIREMDESRANLDARAHLRRPFISRDYLTHVLMRAHGAN